MKVCKTCGVEKPFDDFYLKSNARDNRHTHCKECDKARHREYYQKNKQAAKDRATEWRRDNPEARAKIVARNAKKYPEQGRAKATAYRARKMNAIPPWFCKKAVDAFYAECKDGYEVDHIEALANGGTHSQDNLQYLPRWLNRQKSNRTGNWTPRLP